MTNRKMKDSGVEWIGDIPIHWKLVSVKHLFIIGRGRVIAKTELDDNGDYPVYSSQTKNNGVLGFIDTYDYDVSQLTWTTDGANAGTVFLREGKYNCTNVCGTLLPKISNMSMKYMKYALEYIAIFHKRADTNGFKIMNNEMAVIKILLPLEKEQKKIAAFLDEKVAHIDNIIEDTKKSIENLKFYKQSLITETVTKGLNPNVDMKDSGIEWAGEIPSHWRVNRLKRIFEIKKDIANQLGYDILSVTQKGLKIKDISSNEGQLSADYSKYQIVEENDFVMNHMDLLTGWVDLSKFEGVTSPDYRVFKASKADIINNLFYKYVFQVGYSNKIFYGLGQGVSNKGRWRLPTDQFLNFEIPIPPIEEQQAIAIFLNEKTSHVNLLIEQKEQLINELESYKKSFIYEYVTGKKEVK